MFKNTKDSLCLFLRSGTPECIKTLSESKKKSMNMYAVSLEPSVSLDTSHKMHNTEYLHNTELQNRVHGVGTVFF